MNQKEIDLLVKESQQLLHGIKFWGPKKVDEEMKKQLEQKLKIILEFQECKGEIVKLFCEYAELCYDAEEFLLQLQLEGVSHFYLYQSLSRIYSENNDYQNAYRILDQGQKKHPESLELFQNEEKKLAEKLYKIIMEINMDKDDQRLQYMLCNLKETIQVGENFYVYQDDDCDKSLGNKLNQLVKLFQYLSTKHKWIKKIPIITKNFFSFYCEDLESVHLLNCNKKKQIQKNLSQIRNNLQRMAKYIQKQSQIHSILPQKEPHSKSLDLKTPISMNKENYSFLNSNQTISYRKSSIFINKIQKQPKFTFTDSQI